MNQLSGLNSELISEIKIRQLEYTRRITLNKSYPSTKSVSVLTGRVYIKEQEGNRCISSGIGQVSPFKNKNQTARNLIQKMT